MTLLGMLKPTSLSSPTLMLREAAHHGHLVRTSYLDVKHPVKETVGRGHSVVDIESAVGRIVHSRCWASDCFTKGEQTSAAGLATSGEPFESGPGSQ